MSECFMFQSASIYASGTEPRHRIHLWVGKGASFVSLLVFKLFKTICHV